MSYPALIQPLIIEDREESKQAYEQLFDSLRSESSAYFLAPPRYAFCYADALTYLERSTVFHLVVLDLRLPEKRGQPAAEGVDFGERLLGQCLTRDTYPIPALLVISAHLALAQQGQMRDRVHTGFHYGSILVKGTYDALKAEVEKALGAITRYCGIGIHIRDAGAQCYPTISPREEDLLRRVLLMQEGAVGVDLEWWSAELERTSSSAAGWTKVLMGRVLLDSGDKSRPNFFKFFRAPLSENVFQAARRMQQKLSHVKVSGTLRTSASALIVTEKVGSSIQRPITLPAYLCRDDCSERDIERIVSQIAAQLDALGERNPQSRPLNGILWRDHNAERITSAWEDFAQDLSVAGFEQVTPPELFKSLAANTAVVQYEEQSFVHGDLHLDNIALDLHSDGAEAFIFDAGGTAPHSSVRDFAVLEISLLLHQEATAGESLVDACRSLYLSGALVPDEATIEKPTLAKNTYAFLYRLRIAVAAITDPHLYSLLIFDYALIQLGSLGFGTGKVRDPKSAAALAALAANWYSRIVRDHPIAGSVT